MDHLDSECKPEGKCLKRFEVRQQDGQDEKVNFKATIEDAMRHWIRQAEQQ